MTPKQHVISDIMVRLFIQRGTANTRNPISTKAYGLMQTFAPAIGYVTSELQTNATTEDREKYYSKTKKDRGKLTVYT